MQELDTPDIGQVRRRTIRAALLTAAPILGSYFVLSISFGILAGSLGISALNVFLMSLLIYAGTLQFVAVGLMTGGASLLTLGITTFLLNSRHFFYGIGTIETFQKAGIRHFYPRFALTDENFALFSGGVEGSKKEQQWTIWTISIVNHAMWAFGSAAGVILGDILPIPKEGIDFAMTSLFMAVAIEQLYKKSNRGPSMLGFLISLLFLILFGPDRFLLPTVLAIAGGLLLRTRQEQREELARKKERL